MNRSVFAPILPLKKSSEIVLKILTELSADRRVSASIASAIRNASKQPISESLLEKGLFAIHEKISDHHKLPDLIEKIYCLSALVDKFFIHTVDVDSAQFFNRELSVLLEEELTRFGEIDDPSYVPPSALELADKIFAEIEEKRLSYTKQGPSNEEILISNPSERHDTFTDKQPQMLGFPTEQVLIETDRLKARIKELESINKDLLNLPRYQTEERDDEDSHYHSIQRAGTEKKKPHLRIDNVFDFHAKSTIQRTFDLPAGTPLFNPFNFALGQKIEKVSIFSRRSKKIEKMISQSLRILSQEAGRSFGNFSDLLASEREFSASLEAQLQSKTTQLKVAEDSLAKTRNQLDTTAFDLSKLQKELDLKRVLIDGILASQARQKMEIAELSEKVLSTGKQLGLGSSLSQSLSAEKKQLLVLNENFRKRIVQLESQVQRENEAFGKKSQELKSALEKIESLEDKISFMEVQDKEKLIQIQKLLKKKYLVLFCQFLLTAILIKLLKK